jgi:hypothetical protein
MRTLSFARRLIVTSLGGAIGLTLMVLAVSDDRSLDVHPEGVVLLTALVGLIAAVGAAVTRRWVPLVIAAVLAAATPFVALFFLVVAACASGVCD